MRKRDIENWERKKDFSSRVCNGTGDVTALYISTSSSPSSLLADIVFDAETGGYYPILYVNDYWNLAQEYMPLNSTTL